MSAWYHPALGLLWSAEHPAGIEPLRCARVTFDAQVALQLSDLDLAHLARTAGLTPNADTQRFGRVMLAEVMRRLQAQPDTHTNEAAP